MNNKILLYSPTSSDYSGATWSLIGLCKILIKDEYEVTVLLSSNGPIEALLKKEAINYSVIHHYRIGWTYKIGHKETHTISQIKNIIKRLYNVYALFKTKKYIVRESFDIVHVNAITDGLVAKATLKAKRKLIWHIREFLEEDLQLEFCNKSKAFELMEKADGIIAISRAIKEKYKHLLTNNIYLVYNGIDVNRFFIKRQILCSDIITISIIGRISVGKGQNQIIQALQELKYRGYNNIRLRLIGKIQENDYKTILDKAIMDAELSKDVQFIEHTNSIEKFYRDTDILCICSKKEAFGRVTIEGMIAGALIIGANTGGTAELVEDGSTGYLYEEGNTESLALVIENAINNRVKSRIVANMGQNMAIARFTEDNNAKEIEKVYKLVLDNHP